MDFFCNQESGNPESTDLSSLSVPSYLMHRQYRTVEAFGKMPAGGGAGVVTRQMLGKSAGATVQVMGKMLGDHKMRKCKCVCQVQ